MFKLNLKSSFASFLACFSLCNVIVNPIVSYGTDGQYITLGDVNGDGVSAMDAVYIQQYLSGAVYANAQQFTAMDYNEDGIVDMADVNGILNKIVTATPSQTKFKNLYSLPDNSSRSYYKHNCSSTNRNSKTTYTLSSVSTALNSINDVPSLMNYSPDSPDYENPSCVRLTLTDYDGNISYGSGFVIDDNVIVTAAHCLIGANGFKKKVTVELYDDEEGIVCSANASYIHVPSNYPNYGSNGSYSYDVNYDYGLVYVNSSVFSDYKVNVGIMSDSYLNPLSTDVTQERELVTSGYSGGGLQRYFSTGNVISMFSNYPNEAAYRFHTNADCPGGKSGGMTYNVKNINNFACKSVVGINTHSYSGSHTFGVRITPTLLRFYLQNPYV